MNNLTGKQMILVLAGIIVGIGLYWLVQEPQQQNSGPEDQETAKADPQNATYIIDGRSITLNQGFSEIQVAPDSASKTITQYAGVELFQDLNDDGITDAAVILRQNSGGSGTFYYLAADLSGEKGFSGTEAVFLGDRITPRQINYLNGEIVVNYLDRKAGEGMSELPSVETAKYFSLVEGKFKETTRGMTELDARTIAEAACIKGGEALGPGTYNGSSKTWWFDANLNATRAGCNPACVVSTETKTAEINWRCTGAIPPQEGQEEPQSGCTMEAKICPDGTAVGRTGPNCEFAPCPNTEGQETIECAPELRNADVCTQIYDPVCAKVNIHCIKAPCNPVDQTFSNSCEACKNPLVQTYVKGECAESKN